MSAMDEGAGGARDTARRAWGLIAAALFAQRRVWLEASNREDLTPPQAFSLMRLRADAPPNLGDLARHMHCDASYVTGLADRLEERGLAERRVSAADRRVKVLVPTEEGLAAQARLRAAYLTPPEGFLDLGPEEAAALLRAAERLAARLDPELLEMLGVEQAAPVPEAAGA